MVTCVEDIPCPANQILDSCATFCGNDFPVNQIAHGFAPWNVLKCIGPDTYALAQSDDPADAEVAGIVAKVVDADNFCLHVIGDLENSPVPITPATVYFLSDTVAGQLTTIEPSTVGHVSKPLLISHSVSGGFFFNFRGIIIESASSFVLPDSGVIPGTYDPSKITVNSKGIITFADNSTAGGGGSGTVTSVSGVLPISVSSPTTTPVISITNGDLTDAGTDGITVTGGVGAVIGSGTSLSQQVADATHNGYLSSTDWVLFNSKGAPVVTGDLTDAGTDGITITGGTGAVVGAGTTLAQHVADATHNGYLSSADWVRFNNATAFAQNHTVTLVVDGAGTALTTGTKNPIKVPFGGTLQGWTMMCKPSGSVTADVFRAANGAGLPLTSIVGGSGVKPAVASGVENSSTSFSNWTSTTITAKDNLAISLSGITAATYCELTLYYQ